VGDIVFVPEPSGRLKLKLKLSGHVDLRPRIYELIKRNDWGLLEFYQESQSLESVFRQLTREN